LAERSTRIVAPLYRGERGLKQIVSQSVVLEKPVAPLYRGERGLKRLVGLTVDEHPPVAPLYRGERGVKHLLPSTWAGLIRRSSLSRGAWVETHRRSYRAARHRVAPLYRGERGLKHPLDGVPAPRQVSLLSIEGSVG